MSEPMTLTYSGSYLELLAWMLLLAFMLAACAALGWAIRDVRGPAECRHRWQITRSTHIDVWSEFGGKYPTKFKTDVAMVCRDCGMPRVKTLPGNWHPAVTRGGVSDAE